MLPYYTKLSEGSKVSTVDANGRKVTRDASYVPTWFKEMKNNPTYRSSYMALQVASTFRDKLGENFKQYIGKIKDENGKALNAAEIAEMAELQTYLEDEIVSASDYRSINNLLGQIENYQKSGGQSTSEEGFLGGIEGVFRDILPGESFTPEDISKLATRFGGIDNLQKVVKNLYFNTDGGIGLTAFGGEALAGASYGAGAGAASGAAVGAFAGGVGAGPGALLGAAGGAFMGGVSGLMADVINLFKGSSSVDFDDIGDDAREALAQVNAKMTTVNQPYFVVNNKDSKQYEKIIKPQAIQIAAAALSDSRMNPFAMNSDNYDYEGISAGGEMVFSYKSLNKAEFETFKQMVSGSGGLIIHDRTFFKEAPPKKHSLLWIILLKKLFR